MGKKDRPHPYRNHHQVTELEVGQKTEAPAEAAARHIAAAEELLLAAFDPPRTASGNHAPALGDPFLGLADPFLGTLAQAHALLAVAYSTLPKKAILGEIGERPDDDSAAGEPLTVPSGLATFPGRPLQVQS